MINCSLDKFVNEKLKLKTATTFACVNTFFTKRPVCLCGPFLFFSMNFKNFTENLQTDRFSAVDGNNFIPSELEFAFGLSNVWL